MTHAEIMIAIGLDPENEADERAYYRRVKQIKALRTKAERRPAEADDTDE